MRHRLLGSSLAAQLIRPALAEKLPREPPTSDDRFRSASPGTNRLTGRRRNVQRGVASAKVGDRHGRPTAELKTLRPACRLQADDRPAHRVRATRRARISAPRLSIAQVPADRPDEWSLLRGLVARRSRLCHISPQTIEPDTAAESITRSG